MEERRSPSGSEISENCHSTSGGGSSVTAPPPPPPGQPATSIHVRNPYNSPCNAQISINSSARMVFNPYAATTSSRTLPQRIAGTGCIGATDIDRYTCGGNEHNGVAPGKGKMGSSPSPTPLPTPRPFPGDISAPPSCSADNGSSQSKQSLPPSLQKTTTIALSIPQHERLPSNRVSFTSAEVLTVSELATHISRGVSFKGGNCHGSSEIDGSDQKNDDDGEAGSASAGKKVTTSNGSVRTTGVVLHLDVPNTFILLGDPTVGARPGTNIITSSSISTISNNKKRSSGGSADGDRLPGKHSVGGRSLSSTHKTPLNRYRRAGSGIGSIGKITATSTKLSSPTQGPQGVGGSLSTAKKRKLVYTNGALKSLAGSVGAASTGTPRPGLLQRQANLALNATGPSQLTGGLGGRSSLAVRASLGGNASSVGVGSIGGLRSNSRTVATSQPNALDIIRLQCRRGVDVDSIVVVDVTSLMPLSGCKVGDTVMVVGEVKAIDPSWIDPTKKKADESNSANADSESNYLQTVMTALDTNGRALVGRIIRNVNGTDMHLMSKMLRLRRSYVQERCWNDTLTGFSGVGNKN